MAKRKRKSKKYSPSTIITPDSSNVPIFIGGAGRSGTTLLVDMLGLHKNITPIYETDFLLEIGQILFSQNEIEVIKREIRQIMDQWTRLLPLRPHNKYTYEKYHHGPHYILFSRDFAMEQTELFLLNLNNDERVEPFRKFIFALYDRHCQLDSKKIWINKTPSYIFNLPFLKKIFPDMKFIHCVRDGRDVACSVITYSWGPSTFEQAAGWWGDTVSLGVQYSEQYPGTVLEVRYEDLLTSPRKILPGIFEWLGQNDDTATVLSHYHNDNAPSLNTIPVQRWKTEMPSDELKRFEEIASQMLTHFGYIGNQNEKQQVPHKTMSLQASIQQVSALADRADRLFKQQKIRQALRLLQQAEKILVSYPHIPVENLYYSLARCYRLLNQNDKAIEAIEKELAIYPDNLRLRHMRDYLQSSYAQLKNCDVFFDGQTVPTQWPSVSLCMIVKNEEEHLADCLRSVGGFADETIIVDTGSTDRTVEIAEEFGARVEYFEWIDDFAAARNESIKYATGDWIFWMDADDRLSANDLIKAKQALVSGKADIYSFLVQSSEKDQKTQARHFRLFKNKIGLQFERPMHEELNAGELGLTVAHTNVVVKHTGYDITLESKRNKYRRNIQIIQKILDKDPTDTYWLHHLGVCLSGLGDYEAAVTQFEKVLDNPSYKLSIEFDIYQTFILSIQAHHFLQNRDAMENVIAKAKKVYPQNSHLHTYLGHIYLVYGKLALAQEHLEIAQALPMIETQGISYGKGKVSRWLSRAYLQQKKYTQAKQNFLRYIKETDKKPFIVASGDYETAQMLMDNKDYLQVIKLFASALYYDAAIARLVSKAFARLNNWGNAIEALENAIILSIPQSGEWAMLGEYTLKEKASYVAQHYCKMALEEDETDLKALNTMGIIAMQYQKDIQGAATYFAKAVVADPDFAPAFNNLNQIAQSVKTSPLDVLINYGRQLLTDDPRQAINVFSAAIKRFPDESKAYRLLSAALNRVGQTEDALLVWQTADQLEQAQ